MVTPRLPEYIATANEIITPLEQAQVEQHSPGDLRDNDIAVVFEEQGGPSSDQEGFDDFGLEPEPRLPLPDEGIPIERRIYARFDHVLDTIKRPNTGITLLDGECREIDDVTVRPDNADAETATAEHDDHVASARLTQIHKVQDCIGKLFCPPSGKPLGPQQRKDVIDLMQECLKCDGIEIGDIISSTTSKSKNLESLVRHQISALTSGDGWVSRVFEVHGGRATAHWNSNAIKSLAEKVVELFPFMETESLWDGENYGHPSSGQFMKEFGELIRSQREFICDWNKERDFPLLLTYFSDATLLANRGSASAHPVVVGIGNLPHQMYAANLITVGYLDSAIQFANDTTKEEKRQVKKSLVAQQVSAMMEQFVLASYTGYSAQLLGPVEHGENHGRDGKIRFFPGLFHAALDYPEVVSMLGIKTGSCGVCYWNAGLGGPPLEDGKKFRHGVGVYRTEKRSRESWQEMNQVTKKARVEELMSLYGCHPQRPEALWGFNGSCPLDSVPESVPLSLRDDLRYWAVCCKAHGQPTNFRSLELHLAVTQERMHEMDLGLTIYLRDAILKFLKERMQDKEIERLVNVPLHACMTVESRWQGLIHPPYTKETADLKGYFGGCSRVQAKEHRCVLQVLVPVLWRSLGRDHSLTRLAALYLKYYTTRECRLSPSQSHTEASLAESERLFLAFHSRISSVAPVGKLYNQPKMHVQLHFAERVRRAGISSITTGEAGEAQNAAVKAPYKGGCTNRQTRHVQAQLIRHRREAEASARVIQERQKRAVVLASPQTKKGEATVYTTSAVLAVRLDTCAFTKHSNARGLDIFSLTDLRNFLDTKVGSKSFPLELLAGDTTSAKGALGDLAVAKKRELKAPDAPPLHKHILCLFGSQSVVKSFLHEVTFWLLPGHSKELALQRKDMNVDLKVVRGAVNPSILPGEDRATSNHRLLQRLRCSSDFRPVADGQVQPLWNDFVAITGSHTQKGDSMWYARLILMFHAQDPISRKWIQLAFVRYLVRVEEKAVEEARFAKHDDTPLVTVLKYATRRISNKEEWYYGVILVESIARKVHIVAGNTAASKSLSFSRGEPQWTLVDKNSKLLLNHYTWQSESSSHYVIEG